MPFQHPIIHLLNSLNKGQVRFVRSRLPNKQLRLFDFLTAQKNLPSKEKIQKAVETTAFGLLALLSELEKAVVMLVGEYAQRKRPAAQIQQLISLGHGYLELGDLPKATKAFEMAQSEAMSAGDHAVALHVAHILKAYLPLGRVDAADEEAASAERLAETLRLLDRGRQLHQAKRLPLAERVSAVSAILSALSPPSDRGNLILHYALQIRCYALLGRFDDIIIYYKHLTMAINADTQQLYSPTILSFSVSACILLSFACIEVDNIDRGLYEILKFTSWLSALHLPLPERLNAQQIYLLTMQSNGNQTLESVNAKAYRINAAFQKGEISDSSYLLRLFYEVSVQYFRVKGFHEARTWVDRLLKAKASRHALLWLVNALILDLILYIELGEYEGLSLALRRADYALSKIKSKTSTIKVLNKFVSAVLSNPQKANLSTNLLVEARPQLEVDAKDYKLVAILELLRWAEQKQ